MFKLFIEEETKKNVRFLNVLRINNNILKTLINSWIKVRF